MQLGSASGTTGMTQEQQGKTEIKNPRGSMWATQEQAANMMTPRTVAQQSSRSPAEQQAMLANVRKNALALNQQRTKWVEEALAGKGQSSPFGTDRFGRPLKMFAQQQAARDAETISQPATTATGPMSSGFMRPFDSGLNGKSDLYTGGAYLSPAIEEREKQARSSGLGFEMSPFQQFFSGFYRQPTRDETSTLGLRKGIQNLPALGGLTGSPAIRLDNGGFGI